MFFKFPHSSEDIGLKLAKSTPQKLADFHPKNGCILKTRSKLGNRLDGWNWIVGHHLYCPCIITIWATVRGASASDFDCPSHCNVICSVVIVSNNATPSNPKQPQANPKHPWANPKQPPGLISPQITGCNVHNILIFIGYIRLENRINQKYRSSRNSWKKKRFERS